MSEYTITFLGLVVLTITTDTPSDDVEQQPVEALGGFKPLTLDTYNGL